MQRLLPLLLAFALTACGGLVLQPVTPPSTQEISNIEIEYDPLLEGQKARVLDKYEVKRAMTEALQQSFAVGDGTLHILVTQFRTGGWGPSRMHTVCELRDASGAVLKTAETDSTSVMRGAPAVFQDTVNQIVAQLM